MNVARLRTLVGLELRQRLRSVAWYVLLGVFAVILLIVTVLGALAGGYMGGGFTYSLIVFFVLLLALLVSPALSGNAINGERDAATLAPVQVTLATTPEIVFAKVIAAWATGLGFAVVAVPFVLIAALGGELRGSVALVSVVIVVIEIAVVGAIGVGISGLIAKPLFSVVTTYLVVMALLIGTPIAFGLASFAVRSEQTYSSRQTTLNAQGDPVCGEWVTDSVTSVPRTDYFWWTLAPNPFVILADATPPSFGEYGYPTDLFGQLSSGVRYAQVPPELDQRYDACDTASYEDYDTAEQIYERTAPSWFIGLALQMVLAALLVWGAIRRTRTPSRKLPPGTRIA